MINLDDGSSVDSESRDAHGLQNPDGFSGALTTDDGDTIYFTSIEHIVW